MDIERTMFWAGLFAILFVYLAFQTALARTRRILSWRRYWRSFKKIKSGR